MFTLDEMRAYKAPRWNELPDIELYMDQVLAVLDKQLSIFKREPDEKLITSAMINNYVKQKITLPPVNKKYTRYHLAYLYTVCVLKNIMGLSDICRAIGTMLNGRHTAEAFDMFCLRLDSALAEAFFGERAEAAAPSSDVEHLLKAVTTACANVLYSRYLLSVVSGDSEGEK